MRIVYRYPKERFYLVPGANAASQMGAEPLTEELRNAIEALHPREGSGRARMIYNLAALISLNDVVEEPYADEAVATAMVRMAKIHLGRDCKDDEDIEFYEAEETMLDEVLAMIAHRARRRANEPQESKGV